MVEDNYVSESEGIAIRFMEAEDVPAILDCEKRHAKEDKDFEVELTEEFVWTESDILEAASQYKNKQQGTHDTRSLVAVDETSDKEWVCGALIYEIQPEEYEILLLTVHKKAPAKTRQKLLDVLLTKAGKSNVRKRLSMYCPDGEWDTLSFLKNAGFDTKLKFNSKGNDCWFCVLKLPPCDDKSDMAMAG